VPNVEVLSIALQAAIVVLLVGIVYLLWRLRREWPERSAASREFYRFLASERDTIGRQTEALSTLGAALERQTRNVGESSQQMLALFQRQQSQTDAIVGSATRVTAQLSEIRRALSTEESVRARLGRIATQNFELVNQEDDQILRDYIASEMLLNAKLQEIQADLLTMPIDEWAKLVRGSKVRRMLDWMKEHKIGELLLEKLNELVKSALPGGDKK
jgi:hypothetical protein